MRMEELFRLRRNIPLSDNFNHGGICNYVFHLVEEFEGVAVISGSETFVFSLLILLVSGEATNRCSHLVPRSLSSLLLENF